MSAAPKRSVKAGSASTGDVAKDFKVFEALPEKTKVLVSLQDDADKTTGPAAVALQKKIKSAGEGR